MSKSYDGPDYPGAMTPYTVRPEQRATRKLSVTGRKGTGSILDRENRALISCCRPKLRFSGALKSNKLREQAHYFRVFRRERKKRGLAGGERWT
jgi:hypothetical protein